MAFSDHGLQATRDSFNMAQAMVAQQGRHMAGMINATTGAIGNENESRVAQQREMRRMQHEINLKQMELDAILKRIEAARQSAETRSGPRVSFPGGAIY